MKRDTAARLLASILSGRLIIFCGAGLSMAPDSAVPAAATLAEKCFDKYAVAVAATIPDTFRHDLEKLTAYFLSRGELDSVFVDSLVDWDPFNGDTNHGHRAIADLLKCDALESVISTNIDHLIELAAREIGATTFDAALDGAQMNRTTSHLLKIHGCRIIDRTNMLWCHEQLAGPFENATLKGRIAASETWLKANLPNRDMVFVGFWSDWKYLNDVFVTSLPAGEPRLVVIVDPKTSVELEEKAPDLWTWANSPGHTLIHEQESGADFLDELRCLFSASFLEQLLDEAKIDYAARTGATYTGTSEYAGHTSDEYYELRRDVTGVGHSSPVIDKSPAPHMHHVGVVHLMLRGKGATHQGTGYDLRDGRRVKVLNGLSRGISRLKGLYPNPDTVTDVVICSGSFDDGGVPPHLVRGALSSTTVRPASAATWLTDQAAVHAGVI